MAHQKRTHAGSDVGRKNKICADLFSLRQSVKGRLGDDSKKRKDVALYLAVWNVRTLMVRTAAQRPEKHTTLVAIKLDRYGIDIVALSKTIL